MAVAQTALGDGVRIGAQARSRPAKVHLDEFLLAYSIRGQLRRHTAQPGSRHRQSCRPAPRVCPPAFWTVLELQV